MQQLNLRLTLLLCLFTAMISLHAQSDFILLNQQFNPHKTSINPAFLPKEEFYLGLPVISNTYASFSNNSFAYRDLIKKKTGSDSIYFDFQGFVGGLKKQNHIAANFQTDLVSLGWREGRWYINANITEKVNLHAQFNKDLMDVALNGNGPKIGQTAELGDLYISASHYREYGVGLSRDFLSCKLRLGATLKYLYGMENVDVNRSNITLTTDAVTFDLTGTSDILINTSGLNAFSPDSLRQMAYLFKRPNRGFAADLGAEYKINDRFDVFASVLDLGSLGWKYDTKNYYNKVPDFTFSGVQLEEFLSSNTDTITDGIQQYLDSLTNIFSIKEKSEAYRTALSTRFYLGGHYILQNRNFIQFAMMGSTYKGKLFPAVSLGFTKRFGDVLEFSLNGAYQNNTFANLGAGFTLNLGLTQFSIISDNLLGLAQQYTARGTNLRAGITLVTGYDSKRPNFCDKDGDGIENSKDDCPEVAGLATLNGCPDSDQDGIADYLDECPLEAGELDLKGCPDKDRDGIADKLDKCPDEAGKAENNGCPDKDEDGVIDKDDVCPNLAGFAYLGGCPDRDLDSIPDREDDCPDVKGPRSFSGCPDSDGDGLIDKEDECIDEAGPLKLKGCPDSDADGFVDYLDACPTVPGTDKGCPEQPRVLDTDKDGVTDAMDKCPDVAGSVINNGCPELAKEEQAIINTAFESLEFESNKAIIKESSFESLERLSELMKVKSNWHLLVSGHTDNVGKAQNNLVLSKNRANALKTYLISKGIEAERIHTEWFGQTKPIANNGTEAGRQKNRRVEMTILQNQNKK